MAEPEIPETVAEAVEIAAKGMVKSSKEKDSEVEYFSPRELIDADNHLANKAAAAKAHFGLRMTRCIPPGGG